MEMTASIMLNAQPVNDLMQTSRMSSFPSSESISSAVSWHGTSESYAINSGKSQLKESEKHLEINLNTQGATLNSLENNDYVEKVFQKVSVEILPEKYGFLKKHFKYLITGPVSYRIKV